MSAILLSPDNSASFSCVRFRAFLYRLIFEIRTVFTSVFVIPIRTRIKTLPCKHKSLTYEVSIDYSRSNRDNRYLRGEVKWARQKPKLIKYELKLRCREDYFSHSNPAPAEHCSDV